MKRYFNSSLSKIVLAILLGIVTLDTHGQGVVTADCMLTMLGKPLASDSVRSALASYGIVYKPEVASHTLISLPHEGVLLKTKAGKLQEIILFNDSVPYQGQTYLKFKAPTPLSLTFSDSVGMEENLLFRQDGREYSVNNDGVNVVSILTHSGNISYTMQEGYLPAQSYYYYKKTYPKMKLHRNLFYRFMYEESPKGTYLNLPLLCGSSKGGRYSSGYFASRADSAYFIGIQAGYRGLGTQNRMRQSVEDGGYFGLNLMFPFNSKVSPPLLQVAGFDFAFYSYRDSTKTVLTSQNQAPTHNQFSLYYGAAYLPTLKKHPHFRPMAQLIGGVQFDYSPKLTVYTIDPPISSSSSSLFYQVGLGAGYELESGLILQLMAHYRATNFVRYLRYNPNAHESTTQNGYPDLEVWGTNLKTISIELSVKMKLF